MMNFCEKMALRGILFIVCLFSAVMAVADDAALKTPELVISKTGYGDGDETPVFFNDRQFEEPSLVVYESKDHTAPITSRFTFYFYLTSDTENGTVGKIEPDKEKKEWCTDAKTGTRVNVRTGDVETGSKPGIVYVHVKITPRPNYTGMFSSVKKSYRISLNKVRPTATIIRPDFVVAPYHTNWTAATNSQIALPQFKLQYSTTKDGQATTHDVTDHYTVKAALVAKAGQLFSIDEISTKNLYNKVVKAQVINIGAEAGEATLVFSFEPKDDAYGAVDEENVPLHIVDTKVKPHLVFAEPAQVKYTAMQNDSVQRPVVYDQFGNDITLSVAAPGDYTADKPLRVSWTAEALPDGAEMHPVPADGTYPSVIYVSGKQQTPADGNVYVVGGGPSLYGLDALSTGGAAYYKDKLRTPFSTTPSGDYDYQNQCAAASYDAYVYCMVYPNSSNATAKANYDVTEDKYTITIQQRPVDILLSPNPEDVKFAQGVEMDFKNFFDVKARHVSAINDTRPADPHKKGEEIILSHYTDKNVESYGYGFNYWVKFKRGEVKLTGYPYEDNESYHIALDKDGQKVDLKSEAAVYDVYWAIKKHGGDGDWKMTFPQTGKFDLEFGLDYYNRGWYAPSQTSIKKTFEVVENVTPVVKVTPDPLVLYTTDKELPVQPAVSITDMVGKDIKEHYDYKFDAATLPAGLKLDNNGDIVVELDADGKPKLQKGTYDVKVIATAKEGETKYANGEATFKIVVKDLGERTRFEWDVYNEYGNTNTKNTAFADGDKQHGKLVFTKAGSVSGGYSIDAIPGLSLTLGRYNPNDEDDDYWSADLSAEDNKVYVGDGTVIVGENGIPTNGSFYKVLPRTNGFLYIDANFTEGNNVVLISADGSKKQTISAAGEKTVRFPLALMANTTYYIYDESNAALRLHGMNFLPGFVRFENDAAPIEAATAYTNGFAGELPQLIGSTVDADLVSFGLHGHDKSGKAVTTDKNGGYSNYSNYIDFDAKRGYVKTSGMSTYKEFTKCEGEKLDENFKSLATADNRIKVYAKVKSAWKPQIMQIPFYDLYVGAIPTYVVNDGEIPDVRQVVHTENYPTYMSAIFGGWINAEDRPYFKKNDATLETLVDAWKTAKKDSVGKDNRTIDNFAFGTFGTQNPTTEDVGNYKYDEADENLTHKLPCRGTYAQFEPTENGTLLVYIIQNGMVAWDGNEENKTKSGNNKVKLNTVFITDETGKPVKLSAVVDEQGVTDGGNTPAYTEAEVRCSYKELIDNCSADGQLDSGSDKNAVELLKKIGYMPDGDKEATIKRGDKVQVLDVAQLIGAAGAEEGSMGYTVVSKAYTRYSFKVKAGKTYFVFMNGSKIGNNGFAFLPDGWTPGRKMEDVKADEVVLDEQGSKEGSKDEFLKNTETFAHYDKPVNVKLYHSGLKAEQWTSICLPFSMNEDQFKRTFGDDAWIISFDNVENQADIDGVTYDNVANFTQHCYHWIVAGRPYFIRPGKNFKPEADADSRSYIMCDSVTIEHGTYGSDNVGKGFIKPMTLTSGKENFHFVGNYDATQMKVGDYFIGYSSDGDNTDAMLFRDDKGYPLKGYRAHISTQQSGAKLGTMHMGEITDDGSNATTGIATIFDQPAERGNLQQMQRGVYGIDGTQLSDNANDLDALPAGVYVVNGKCIVK